MKNRLLNVIAIAVITIGIFALSMAGCDNGTNSANNTATPTVITIAAIEGVTAPVTGETPVTTITENAQYSGTVTWNGNPATFAGSTVYIATITLTPKTGYTLQGVTSNFFTVAQTTSVTHAADSGVITAVFAATDRDTSQDYITVWPNQKTKQINVNEGTITVALLATGKYCDVYYDTKVSQPTELQLRQIVSKFDKDYEKLTSFLGLYEKGGGPGGNGGADGIKQIQTYIYKLNGAGGRASGYNGEIIYWDLDCIEKDVIVHELTHLICFENLRYSNMEGWYIEFLPCISEYVFFGSNLTFPIGWATPNVQLFGLFNGDYESYNTYRKFAKFLVDKYGDSILYDLCHENALNKQALENVLRKKDTTLQAAEVEFANWCDNFGYPNDNETRIIIIDNVTLTGQVGVWLTANLPSGNNVPVNTAIQYGIISNNKIAFPLVVPENNTWNSGPPWLGSGDYYVLVVPIVNQGYQRAGAMVYTGDGTAPVKVTINKAITRLSFNDFRSW